MTRPALGRPSVPEVQPLAVALYRRPGGGVGCCLHIVLDDGNVEDGHVRFSLDHARKAGHADCVALAERLLEMTTTQRSKLRNRTHEELMGGDRG